MIKKGGTLFFIDSVLLQQLIISRETLLPHVQASVESYKSFWKIIRYNHRSLSSSVSSRSNLSKTLSVTLKQEFEVDFQGLPSESSSELGMFSCIVYFKRHLVFFQFL